MPSKLYSQAAGPEPRGLDARYLEAIEETGRRQFGLTPTFTNDRERLQQLHGGPPGFPGWLPTAEGGAFGFWIDWRDRTGRTRATGGALAYTPGPATLAEFINVARGFDAGGHEIRLEGEAWAVAEEIRGTVIFSGNLMVFDRADRKTLLSRWLTEITPLMNKAVANARYGEPSAYITIIRDQQVEHLQPRYRLPVLVPGVRWRQPAGTETLGHLGVQRPKELHDALRSALH